MKQQVNTRVCFLLVMVLSITNSFAQKYGLLSHESIQATSIIVSGGLSKLQGDIGGLNLEKPYMKESGYVASLGYRVEFPSRLGYMINLDYHQNKASDIDTHLNYRVLVFDTKVIKFEGRAEYNLIGGSFSRQRAPMSLFLFAGSGLAYSKPILNREYDYLRYYETLKTDIISPVAFAGVNYRFRLNSYLGIGLEYKFNFFFTDFVDGYHTVWSDSKDVSSDFKVSFSFFMPLNNTTANSCDCRWF